MAKFCNNAVSEHRCKAQFLSTSPPLFVIRTLYNHIFKKLFKNQDQKYSKQYFRNYIIMQSTELRCLLCIKAHRENRATVRTNGATEIQSTMPTGCVETALCAVVRSQYSTMSSIRPGPVRFRSKREGKKIAARSAMRKF